MTNPSQSPAPARSRLRNIIRLVAAVVTIGVVVELGRVVREDGPAALAAWRAADVRWGWMSLAVALALAGHAIFVVGWQRMLTDAGTRAPYWQLARIFLASNLGRYLPGGKAWQMAIVAAMAAERALPAGVLSATSLLQGILGVGVGAIVLFATGGATLGLPIAWIALAVAGVGGLVFLPAIVRRIPRVRAMITRFVPAFENVTAATMWALIWTAAVSWLLWGVAFYSLGHAVVGETGTSVVAYIAAWAGSFLAGLILIVAPAGLGAREGTMHGMLEQFGMGASELLILVVVARVWITVLDIVPAAAVLLLRRRKRDRAASGDPSSSI